MNSFETLLLQQNDVKVIDASIPFEAYVPLDLSVNSNFLNEYNPQTAEDYEEFLADYLTENKAQIAFGGYLEKRKLYKRSSLFKASNPASERNIHIGLDLWIKSGTAVLAAVDGIVHSFQNNTSPGDYGPTIILKHTLNNCEFYTLYGHLSLESLALLHRNQTFKKGDKIGSLGDAAVNGNYASHLHFQIIFDIAKYQGDYPGVCSENNLNYFQKNCPDPNLLLKI